jgi:acyl carrier protein
MPDPTPTTFARLRGILVDHFGVEPDDITPETTLSDLSLDSLDEVELVMEIECQFRIEALDIAIPASSTLADIVAMIDKLAGGIDG